MNDDKPPRVIAEAEQEKPVPANQRSKKFGLLIGGVVVLFLIIALGLGLGIGLGLGLKHHHGSSSSAVPSASASPSSTASGTPIPSTFPSWRRDPSDYNLDMSWDINATPTTRVFNITVSEIQAAPDGECT